MPRRTRPDPDRFITKAERYGRSRHVEYVMPPGGTQAQLAAAKTQHEVALHAREWCLANGIDDPEQHLADQVGQSRAAVVRKLNGQVTAGLDDIYGWVLATAIEVLPIPQGRDELLPEHRSHSI